MPEPFDDPKCKQKKTSHLKLVVSNPPPVQKEKPSQKVRRNTGFISEIRMRSPSQYILVASDPFHRLDCELVLELHDNEDEHELEARSIVCHFPDIIAEGLSDFVQQDETLYAMILIQFQIKLLELVLLFCSNHDTLNLIIYANDTFEGHALGIYENLVAYENKLPAISKIPTATGTKTQMLIPTTRETFDKCIDLMHHVSENFRKALWEEKGANPCIRGYLKSNPDLKFFA